MINSALQRLQARELSLGILLKQARTTEIAVAMKAAGYDWLFLDLEHNAMSALKRRREEILAEE